LKEGPGLERVGAPEREIFKKPEGSRLRFALFPGQLSVGVVSRTKKKKSKGENCPGIEIKTTAWASVGEKIIGGLEVSLLG